MLPKTLCRLGKPGNHRETPLPLPCPPSTWTLLLVSSAHVDRYTHVHVRMCVYMSGSTLTTECRPCPDRRPTGTYRHSRFLH